MSYPVVALSDMETLALHWSFMLGSIRFLQITTLTDSTTNNILWLAKNVEFICIYKCVFQKVSKFRQMQFELFEKHTSQCKFQIEQ